VSATLSARLLGHVTLDARTDGNLVACFDGHSVALGKISPRAGERARHLRAGLPLAALAADARIADELGLLVRRLARHGLLEYSLARLRAGRQREEQVVIEPQVADYWPNASEIDDADELVLSRFAYLRRRGDHMVLESPLAGALLRICDPGVAAAMARLSVPQPLKRLRRHDSFPGLELLAVLVDCGIVFKVDPARGNGRRTDEGDSQLVLWDFHDLLFHARSTQGRHANPTGGVYPYAGVVPPLPPVRERWSGRKIDLRRLSDARAQSLSPLARLLRKRHSTRSFDDRRPITLAELARFLDAGARVQSQFTSTVDIGGADAVPLGFAARPYPSGGGSWPLELYLAINACKGLARGFYHYNAGTHALVLIEARPHELDALLGEAAFAMGVSASPQVVITIAARFGRSSWKYSSLAYGLILKDVGVLMQTLYLTATEMGLGGCAIGSVNIDQFARITGLEFHVEGPVGQFAFGRPSKRKQGDRN
jgi:SagB-type dehydrogenase family enzyme